MAAAADYSAVFAFACKGVVPEGAEAQSQVARYLTAAQQLKDLQLQPDAPREEAGGQGEPSTSAAASVPLPTRKRNRAATAAAAAVATGDVLPASDAEVLAEACRLVRKWRFGFEHVGDSRLLRSPELWGALLEHMPMTAMVRNLGRITSIGALAAKGAVHRVVQQLNNPAVVGKARLHPIALLEAHKLYASGRGAKGKLTWSPDPAVTEALEAAFYLSFKNVERTGAKWLLGVDVSGSMGCANVCGMTLTAREAAAAMTMALLRCEAPEDVHVMGFSDTFRPLLVNATMKLHQVENAMSKLPFAATDCALPITYALQHCIPVDVFVVLTDNETWCGSVHPTEALRRYRTAMKRPHAKLIVLAFSATEFSIADPADPRTLDIAGLDSAVPRIIHDFVTGKL